MTPFQRPPTPSPRRFHNEQDCVIATMTRDLEPRAADSRTGPRSRRALETDSGRPVPPRRALPPEPPSTGPQPTVRTDEHFFSFFLTGSAQKSIRLSTRASSVTRWLRRQCRLTRSRLETIYGRCSRTHSLHLNIWAVGRRGGSDVGLSLFIIFKRSLCLYMAPCGAT